LDYGSDATYENSVVGTPSKGSEVGLEMEMEALAVEEQAAIVAEPTDRIDKQQQERTNPVALTENDNEAVGTEVQNQAEFMDDVTSDEVRLLAYMCRLYRLHGPHIHIYPEMYTGCR